MSRRAIVSASEVGAFGVAAAVARLAAMGTDVARRRKLTRAGSAPAYRLDLIDGGVLKLRIFVDEAAAARVFRLLGATGAMLPRRICQFDRALVVTFVDGVALDRHLRACRDVRAERVRLAGRVGRWLAHLHGLRVPAAGDGGLDAFVARFAIWTKVLRARGGITRPVARRMAAIAPPRSARLAMTHGDLAPENIVLTPGGRLRAIDEERLDVRPAAFDLARTITRWPLDAVEEDALLAAYSGRGGQIDDYLAHRTFWLVSMAAASAHYRVVGNRRGARPRLAYLNALVERLGLHRDRPRSPPDD